MQEIILRYVSLPCSVRGYVQEDANGDYNIYINSRLSYEMQQTAIQHELNHIKKNHFYNEEAGVNNIEADAECAYV